ncbi:mitochondrial 18 KDa protein-domain-containing protein [Aspergillus cavernicola]|uniref:Mitochondrial fission process protein 1 n=1 Tax=Aspergillus cavernicola TaxID=176166 RepID=A0ABR4IXF0_9EURO
MLWGSRKKEPPEAPPQPPIKRAKLPPQMQEIVDQDDHFYDDVYTPYSVDSIDTPYRYAGYATRLRTLLLSAHRYVAYTSDIGESFRPVAHPFLVRSAYGISWAYLLGDVGHEGYKAYLRNRHVLAPPCEAYKDASDLTQGEIMLGMVTGDVGGSLSSSTSSPGSAEKERGEETLTPWPTTHIPLIEDYRVVMAKRAVFQGLASMGLPALTIHSVVKYSGRMMKGYKNVLLRTWAPIGLGLAVVPFLPYIFDHPVDHAVDRVFRSGLWLYAGDDAVRSLPPYSEVAGIANARKDRAEDSASLTPFQMKELERVNGDSKKSWDEYKDELQRAKEERKREREGRGGGSGVLAMLGFGSGKEEKRKTE